MTVFKRNHFRSMMPDGTIFVDPNGNTFSLKEESKPVKTRAGNVIGKDKKGAIVILEENDEEYYSLKEGEILVVPASLAKKADLKFETDVAGASKTTHIRSNPVKDVFFIHRAHQRSATMKIWKPTKSMKL